MDVNFTTKGMAGFTKKVKNPTLWKARMGHPLGYFEA